MEKTPGVSKVETDRQKLQATFVYDDEKTSLKEVCETLDKESRGRYKPLEPKVPSKTP